MEATASRGAAPRRRSSVAAGAPAAEGQPPGGVSLPTLMGKLKRFDHGEVLAADPKSSRSGRGIDASSREPQQRAAGPLDEVGGRAGASAASAVSAASAGRGGRGCLLGRSATTSWVLPGRPPLHRLLAGRSVYEQACRERSILPKFIRAVHDGCMGRELDLTGVSLGDLQLEALLCDAALVPAEKVTRWRLRDTRISPPGVAALAKVLPWETEMICLARNDLSGKGVRCLAAKIDEGRLPRLRSLDLSNCGITCTGLDALARALLQCPFLLRLDLDHNAIADGAPLRDMVSEHTHLSRLSLNHNYLVGRAVAVLFHGLLDNARNGGQIADVGLAWNGFGKSDSLAAAEAISDVLANSVTLYHLDLSYNGLDAGCCAAIGNGLKDNHHLYGLHLVGNRATMDADGFLQPLDDAGPSVPQEPGDRLGVPGQLLTGDPRLFASNCLGCGASSLAEQRLLPRRNSQPLGERACSAAAHEPLSEEDVLRERDPLEQRTTCWACEGWTRVELEWRCQPGEPSPSAVWAFTSLDGFRSALRLQRREAGAGEPECFAAARMVPGGCKLGVLFQVDGRICVAPTMTKEALSKPVELQLRSGADPGGASSGRRPAVSVSEMGTLSCPVCSQHARDHMHGQRTVLVDGPDGCPVQLLRVTETEFKLKQQSCLRTSAYYDDFAKEDVRLVEDCLMEDWIKAKVGRIVQEQDWDAVLDVLRGSYRHILSIYRLTSTSGVTGDTTFGVNQIELSDLVAKAGLLDSRTRIADVDRLFIASKVSNVSVKRAPVVRTDKALARHQFLEFWLRLADQRYVQCGEKTIAEAVGSVLEQLRELGELRQADLESFLDSMHTDAVDDVFQKFKSTLQAAYKEFAGRTPKPGTGGFLSFSDFQDFLEHVDAYTSEFTRQRAGFAFRMGMMTQREESYSSRFQEMSFGEFQHALGAVVWLRDNVDVKRLSELLEAFLTRQVAPALRGRGHVRGAAASTSARS